MPEALPSVSVIVPVYNAGPALPRLMRSLRAQTYPTRRVELLMIDNGSSDRSAQVVRGFPEVTALSQTAHIGPAATRNAGIDAASNDVLAFIDADCWAHPRWLETGVDLIAKGFDRVAGHVAFVLSRRPNAYEVYDSCVNFRQTDFLEQGWSGTGNLFVRRPVFDEVGPFDPALLSHEDREFGMRATAAGKTLAFAPEAVVYHHARRSLKSLFKKWLRTEYGAAQLYRTHGILELHLWRRKANWRPLLGVWRDFPDWARSSLRQRLAIDGIANLLRLAGNIGSFCGDLGLGSPFGAR